MPREQAEIGHIVSEKNHHRRKRTETILLILALSILIFPFGNFADRRTFIKSKALHNVPYNSGHLPVMVTRSQGESKGAVLLHGGNGSYFEAVPCTEDMLLHGEKHCRQDRSRCAYRWCEQGSFHNAVSVSRGVRPFTERTLTYSAAAHR